MHSDDVARGRRWVSLTGHRTWLFARANDLLDFYEGASIDPAGGFRDLGEDGRPLVGGPENAFARQVQATARMVHCFAIAHLMGRPGAAAIVDHGMDFLWNRHRDHKNGGYFWAMGNVGPIDDSKQAYGHAFVLLAASSAKAAGHPDADRLLADATAVLNERFWEEQYGAVAEEFTRDWQPKSTYRGQNANMHLTEALMAAFEVTDDRSYLDKAERIADLLIRRAAAGNGWHVVEHFTRAWRPDNDYVGDPMFHPPGTTPGHSLEWARLLVQLWELGGRRIDWLPDASRSLFKRATADGWDEARGGFYYTLDNDGRPLVRDRFWWPCTEGIGAAAFLGAIDGDPLYEEWYRRIWDWCATHLIDRTNGSWRPQLDDALVPSTGPFFGRPDIYHSLQACLIPLLPTSGSIVRGLVVSELAPLTVDESAG